MLFCQYCGGYRWLAPSLLGIATTHTEVQQVAIENMLGVAAWQRPAVGVHLNRWPLLNPDSNREESFL